TLVVAEPIFPGGPLGWPADSRFAEVLFQQIALEPLLQQSIDGKFTGRLATEWNVAPDGKSVTFKLRRGVKFHDGSDFNAKAVKFNFDALIPTGKSSFVDWESVEVIDDYTVKVNLKKWTNYSLSSFSYEGGAFIVSPTAYEKNGVEWMRQNMVGTGPFKQVGYERDVQVVYEKFADYWNKGRPYVDKIIYKCVADPMTQEAALKNKELDGMASGADKRLADLVASGLKAVTGVLGVGAYFPDSAHPDSPLANLKVREALEYAIDKEAIAKALSYGFWGPAYQYAPSSSTAYDPSLPKRTYNPEKAKQLLAEAGFPNGVEFNFLVTNDEPAKSVAVAVQANWLEIGVKANIQILESAKFEEYARTGWNNGLLYAAPPGPSNWVRTITGVLDPTGANYISVARSQEYIDLFNAAATSMQKDTAKERAVVKYIYDNVMCIPVWEVVRAWVVQPYVKDGGFLSHAGAFYWNADTIWLDK
ncbi:MAG: ABC transporter substrate-binding protein, partial [Dehalococcoidales bacterium]|nr:ABC transporter substrate-binding protein [Dehalococcoidales bacterium]